MPCILHPVFRDLYAQGARLAIERRLARQAERSGDRGVELVIAAFPVHAAANIAAGNGNLMGPLRQHVAVGTGGVHPCPRGRHGRMIVQRFGNLFARRQIGALGKRPSGCEQCDKRPEDDRRSHAILPRADTGTTCQRTGSDRFDWVTASTSVPRASSSTISSSALRSEEHTSELQSLM